MAVILILALVASCYTVEACIVPNCQDCAPFNDTVCDICDPDFVLDGAMCRPPIAVPCIDLKCTSCPQGPAICEQCDGEYIVVNEGCKFDNGTDTDGNNTASEKSIWIPLLYLFVIIQFFRH